MGVVKAQPEFSAVIIGATAHDVDPHRRLGVDVVVNRADVLKHACKPRLIRKYTLIEPLHKPHYWLLPQHRIKLPELDRFLRVNGRRKRDNLRHAVSISRQQTLGDRGLDKGTLDVFGHIAMLGRVFWKVWFSHALAPFYDAPDIGIHALGFQLSIRAQRV